MQHTTVLIKYSYVPKPDMWERTHCGRLKTFDKRNMTDRQTDIQT